MMSKKIILDSQDYIFQQGAYGRVFCTKMTLENIDNYDEEARAIKVFLNLGDKPEEHVKKVFESEVKAYMTLSKNENLKRYIPKFHGKVLVEKIIDINGNDISDLFFLDLAFEMEYIEGNFVKYGRNYDTCNVLKSFIDIGVHDVKDCSVILNNKNKPTKIIDFAMEEFELYN